MENKRNKSSERLVECEEKVKDLERELKREREEKNKEKVTNISLRTKVGACLKEKSNFGFLFRYIYIENVKSALSVVDSSLHGSFKIRILINANNKTQETIYELWRHFQIKTSPKIVPKKD